MDFKLTPEQETIRNMVKDFTEKNIKPVAALYDEENQFPYQNLIPLSKPKKWLTLPQGTTVR
jgi:butyryl-CoA dehydrogenase